MLDIDRISPTRRPFGAAAGYHVWSDLLFIHWRIPVSLLQPLLPRELTIDTYDGSAWVGLVPFRMSGVRPWWSPPIWGISSFPETNVRTYVHLNGTAPGVWFLSLDAAQWLAVQLARLGWGLNYHWAKMNVTRRGSTIEYRSRRVFGGAFCHATAEIGDPFSEGLVSGQARIAKPGTVEHFLVERYLLYAVRRGMIFQGQVHHQPYSLFATELRNLNEQLLVANGVEPSQPPCHVIFSPQVNVEVFGLQPVCHCK
ncbi:MAG: hypothetical protein JWM11_7869 [Planctomycetaceae bacterium]|nr:hypothetical protein [Planctomycetaceae bacterium]